MPHPVPAGKVGTKYGVVDFLKGEMTGANTKTIGAVKLSGEKPTELTFADLSDWVIWQFPRLRGEWLCGAAHPAEPDFGWIPARIQPDQERVVLFAHLASPLSTPEEAAEWIADLSES